MRKEIALILMAFSSLFTFSQQKDLDYYLNKGLQNSPLLTDYQNQLLITRIDSMRLRAALGPQVKALSANTYAPVIKGWGYDEIITNGVNIYAGVSVTKELSGKRNRQNKYQTLDIQYQSIENSGKISEQELKKSITGQYIIAYGSWQNFIFTSEMTSLLKTEEIILKSLTEKGVYKQTEYLSFLINLQQQELHKQSIKNKYLADLSMLNFLCGIEDTSFVPLPDPGLVPEDVPGFTGTVFFEQFIIDSLKLQNDNKQIDISYLPKISLFADGGYYSSLTYHPLKNFGLNAGFTVSVPIHDGGQKKMQHDKITIAELNRRNYLNFYRSQSSQQINRLFQQLGENQRFAEDINHQITYARTLIDTYHKLLETGDMQMSDYFLAVSNYTTAKNMMVENNVAKYQIINELNYWNRTK